ncbi:BrnT family toxin [Haliscomenobacter hydrossis]|uniref:BrnT family toxin n=1 Tax=Haliscomenobacter hydrossis (strain ATCC 27775 / DSM 1100 / LMG 10767 / O) TaxID=760192 RepID=F4L6Z6_HALH1|nr:BrnT family toxin [Haliscomenobacter hydrossis]AEE51951.1 protein of unknown function DUF497 [Haliscomenobacter hydrossis DSM 1100]
MPKFEWDDNKNESNQRKHKISFEDASDVFNDEDRLHYVVKRNDETRYVTIGKAFQVFVTVVYTMRELIIRIISARRSSKEERNEYLANKFSKSDDNNE